MLGFSYSWVSQWTQTPKFALSWCWFHLWLVGRAASWTVMQSKAFLTLLRLLWFLLSLVQIFLGTYIKWILNSTQPPSLPACHQLACSWATDCKLVSTCGAGGGKNQAREPFNAWHSHSLGEWKGSFFLQRTGFQEKLYLVCPKVRLCWGPDQLSSPG